MAPTKLFTANQTKLTTLADLLKSVTNNRFGLKIPWAALASRETFSVPHYGIRMFRIRKGVTRETRLCHFSDIVQYPVRNGNVTGLTLL